MTTGFKDFYKHNPDFSFEKKALKLKKILSRHPEFKNLKINIEGYEIPHKVAEEINQLAKDTAKKMGAKENKLPSVGEMGAKYLDKLMESSLSEGGIVTENKDARIGNDEKELVFKTPDAVNSPSHYTQGIECIDYIESHNMDFCQGNAIKYLTRYKHKNGLEDLLKCLWYIKRLVVVESGKIDENTKNNYQEKMSEMFKHLG